MNSDWSFRRPALGRADFGSGKQSFEELEKWRRRAIAGYEKWLEEKWIFKIQPEAEPPPGAAAPPAPLARLRGRAEAGSDRLLALMLVAFCTGFLPPRKIANKASH